MHRVPNWLTRWGISILLMIVIALLTGASYITYPDIVTAKVVIESYVKPVIITASMHSQIEQMFVKDRAQVNSKTALWVWTTGDTLRSSTSGTIHLLGRPDIKNQVVANETLAIIIPIDAPYRVRGHLPIEGSGKVTVGQQVIIQLDAYPYQEFGSLLASVETISPIEINGHYDIRFSLRNGLITQQGRSINNRINLRGKASILTNQQSLLSRIFDII